MFGSYTFGGAQTCYYHPAVVVTKGSHFSKGAEQPQSGAYILASASVVARRAQNEGKDSCNEA